MGLLCFSYSGSVGVLGVLAFLILLKRGYLSGRWMYMRTKLSQTARAFCPSNPAPGKKKRKIERKAPHLEAMSVHIFLCTVFFHVSV